MKYNRPRARVPVLVIELDTLIFDAHDLAKTPRAGSERDERVSVVVGESKTTFTCSVNNPNCMRL